MERLVFFSHGNANLPIGVGQIANREVGVPGFPPFLHIQKTPAARKDCTESGQIEKRGAEISPYFSLRYEALTEMATWRFACIFP